MKSACRHGAARACSQSSHRRWASAYDSAGVHDPPGLALLPGHPDRARRQPRRADRPAERSPGVLQRRPLIVGGTRPRRRRHLARGRGGRHGLRGHQPPPGRWARRSPPDPTRRSRGEIPVALLTGIDAADVPARLAVLGPGRYNPVNVLWVSAGARPGRRMSTTPGRCAWSNSSPGRTCSPPATSTTAANPRSRCCVPGLEQALGRGRRLRRRP